MKTVLVVGIITVCAAAQSPSEPPTLLRVIRSLARPGAEANAVQPYVHAKAAVQVIGMTAIAGMPDIGYEVISGAPAGTYLVLAPLTSLRTLDDGIAVRTVRSPDPARGGKKAAETGVTREHLLFRVEPRMTYTPEAQ